MLAFSRMQEADAEILAAFNRWESDLTLLPLIHPHRGSGAMVAEAPLTLADLAQRLQRQVCYLIRLEGRLVGKLTSQVDPGHLFREVPGSAWISIVIGEPDCRGQGIGRRAMAFLEHELRQNGHPRIELGVFAFNTPAFHLYQSLGYREIGRVKDFTFWNGRPWDDIRMEKCFDGPVEGAAS